MSKYGNRGSNMPTTCSGPSMKELKEDLKYLKIAIAETLELIENGYIDYHQQDAIYGNLMFRKRNIERQIVELKNKKDK